MITKRYIYKVYDQSGDFLTTWKDVGTPAFSFKINSGLSELTVSLAREFWDFGEGFDVKIGNQLKIYVSDGDTPEDVLIYSGYMSKYHLVMAEESLVEVTCIGYASLLAKRIVTNSSATTINYSTEDPSDVIKDVLDKIATTVTYTADSIEDTGVSVSYDLIQNTAFEAINRMVELAPENWYWYVGADNLLYFKDWDASSPLSLIVGKHISRLDLVKTGEQLVNRYYFLGGGSPQLYKRYDRTSSQSEYGRFDKRDQDERVTIEGTADYRAASTLNNFDHPQMEVSCTVIDSNLDRANGIDIDLLHPGQSVQIVDPRVETGNTLWDVFYWDVDTWDYNISSALGQVMRIEEIRYFGTGAELKLGKIQDQAGKVINNNTIQLETFRAKDSPITPTT